MTEFEIDRLARTPMLASYTSITHFGGKAGFMTKEDVVEGLQRNLHRYFITVEGQRSELQLWQQGGGTHVRSHCHGIWNDDLLKLPVCEP